jgi:UDP-glucose 4-epimerase
LTIVWAGYIIGLKTKAGRVPAQIELISEIPYQEECMKVLVIGGSGLFGRKTISHLLADPDVSRVVCLDLVSPKEWFLKLIGRYSGKFQFVRGDVSNLEDILNAMALYPVDSVVNWAFVMGVETPNAPRLAAKVNALGMCNSFEAARLMGANRVIYASSQTVYGPWPMYGDREVTEDDQTNPTHSYAVCKLFAEILAGQYTAKYGMAFTGLRPTVGYGHGSRPDTVQYWWSDIPSAVAVGKPYAMGTDGKNLSSLVSADDVGEFTRILLHAPSSPHPVYNVGGPPTSPRDMAEALRKLIPEAKITFGEKPLEMRGHGMPWPWKISSARAEADFHFKCYPLAKSLLFHINDARLEAGFPPIKDGNS